jgi:hypothetical protein
MIAGRPAPLMTAIMPTVDSGPTHHAVSTTPAPGGTTPGAGAARGTDLPLELPREISSPSGGRMVPGGTLLLPVAATTTHSTTMSDSAAEVSTGATKTISSRRSPLVVGGAIAAVGLIVVISAFALSSGPSPKPSPASAPLATQPAAPTPAPTVAAAPAVAPTTPTPTSTPTENPPAVEMAAVKQDETSKPMVEGEKKPKQIFIEVDSDPSDAEVWLPDESEARGHTPFKVALDRKASPTRVVLKVRGYADRTVKLDPAKPGPIKVALEKLARDKSAGASAGSTAAGGKKKGFDITGGKSSSPSGYKMMGD